MEAIVLAGGFGTRLAHIIQDVPKPMALVCGKPFLEYNFDYLKKNNVEKIILAVSYKRDNIISYFGNNYNGIEIDYSIEEFPLGTGGGIKQALQLCSGEDIYIINGDSFFDVDLAEMMEFHYKNKADITIATKRMAKFDRYGTIDVRKGEITSFNEKKYTESGLINGGIYLIKKEVFTRLDKTNFSIEKDIFENETLGLKQFSFESDGYFIDIGVPEDYYRAQEEFSKL